MAKKKSKAKAAKSAKPPGKKPSSIKTENIPLIEEEDIKTNISETSSPPELTKICRLCESKYGPFLDVFDSGKIIANKIKDLMPFVVSETDALPHKICFRCSAKIEEFHEFVQKCVKAQDNLSKMFDTKVKSVAKTKVRQLWEENLSESNMSNNAICDALIKMAMEGLKDVPRIEQLPQKVEIHKDIVEESYSDSDDNDNEEIPLKQVKQTLDESFTRSTRTRASERNSNDSSSSKTKTLQSSKADDSESKVKDVIKSSEQNSAVTTANLSFDYDDPPVSSNSAKPKKTEKPKPKSKEKPFNIMDHVSMIKVNGVGVLFQCKLCNRNFLNKDVVSSHGCAKNGVPKEDFTSSLPPAPEPPKPSVVKYINTKTDDIKKAVQQDPPKLKPRIGPASRVKRVTEPTVGMVVSPIEVLPSKTNPNEPAISFSNFPNLKNRYKLVPGPNNTFTLVEESKVNEPGGSKIPFKAIQSTPAIQSPADKLVLPEVIDLDPPVPMQSQDSKPYPVGLFQTLPHHSTATNPPNITTPAIRKQSYTIVKTGNPSKLLISTKPQAPAESEPSKKKSRKSALEVKEDSQELPPYSLTLEDKTVPKTDFFTFVNVDPLLQPSYVLPTDSLLQESQISTSTPPVKAGEVTPYSCNMCSETFSREKKLLAHIQSHYKMMDEECEKLAKTTRKRTRK